MSEWDDACEVESEDPLVFEWVAVWWDIRGKGAAISEWCAFALGCSSLDSQPFKVQNLLFYIIEFLKKKTHLQNPKYTVHGTMLSIKVNYR